METKKIKYRSHRGGVYYTPENTMPAFLDALEKGFDQIETDPNCTKDGVVVLMHDDTINRTCRHADGSLIEKPIRISETTYEELLSFDAGIAHGEQFRGTMTHGIISAINRDIDYNGHMNNTHYPDMLCRV